jgi:hypothetical protein
MKTLTIGDTTYNLAYLISVKYKARTRKDVPRPRSKKPAVAGEIKSDSTLELHFLDCDTVHLKKDKADNVWKKLTHLLELDKTPPEPEISNPS